MNLKMRLFCHKTKKITPNFQHRELSSVGAKLNRCHVWNNFHIHQSALKHCIVGSFQQWVVSMLRTFVPCVFSEGNPRKKIKASIKRRTEVFSNSALIDSNVLSVATGGQKLCCSKTVALNDTLHRTQVFQSPFESANVILWSNLSLVW